MDNTNSSQQGQTLEGAYQYNYTYIEPIAMVDALPQSESFSDPWKVLMAEQVIKLAINTLVVNRGNGDEEGVKDDVRKFLWQILLQTIQEEGKSFKPRFVRALIDLLPRVLLQVVQSTTAEVKVLQQIEKVETIIQQPLQAEPFAAVEVKISQEEIETALQQLLQPVPSTAAGVKASKRPDPTLQPLQDAPSTTAEVEVLKRIDPALQQPIQGIPSNEAEVGNFVVSSSTRHNFEYRF